MHSGQPVVIAVELGISPKGHARYRKLFSQYRHKSAIHRIWYLVARPAIGNTVLAQWRKTERWTSSPRLFVSLFDDVIGNPRLARVFTTGHSPIQLADWLDVQVLPDPAQDTRPRDAQRVSTHVEDPLSTPAA